jgi:hypothetical protein
MLVDPAEIEAAKIVGGHLVTGAVALHIMKLAAKYSETCCRNAVTAEDIACAFKVVACSDVDDEMPHLVAAYKTFLAEEPDFDDSDDEEENEGVNFHAETEEDRLTAQLQAMDGLLQELEKEDEFTTAPVSAWDDEDIYRMTHAHKLFENTDLKPKGTMARCLQNTLHSQLPKNWTRVAIKTKLVDNMARVAGEAAAAAMDSAATSDAVGPAADDADSTSAPDLTNKDH